MLDGIDEIFQKPDESKQKYKPRKASLTDDEDAFLGEESDQDFSDAEIPKQKPLVPESELDEEDIEEDGEMEMEEEDGEEEIEEEGEEEVDE